MLSFIKNWFKQESVASEQAVEKLAEEVREESRLPVAQTEKTQAEKLHDTPLSLHPSWEAMLDMGQKYALSFTLSELPPIEVGNISIVGIKVFPHEDGVEVTAFVRNGSASPIQLKAMPLVLLIGGDELFARQTFDLSELGEIPAFHARPWSFVFTKENFLQVSVLLTNWKLAFEMAQKKLVLPQQLELEESWIKALSDEQKNSLIELAKTLPGLQPGEVNIQSVQISQGEDLSLRALLLIRNGSDQSLSFEKVPLVLYDAANEPVAQGVFELDGLTVNKGTSKPWLFIFPKESLVKENPELSRWRVAVPGI